MKNLWYHFFKYYVKIGLFFSVQKIKVYGKEHIPKKGAVLFIGNHQNALIDAILIPTTNNRNTYFLARASAFKYPLAAKLLKTLNMIPVYRIRDGVDTVQKNIEIFEQCVELLQQEKAIEIFAEGQHHLKRRIIPLKKGFARIIFSAVQKYPNLNIQIVPVGINYNSRLNFPCSVSVYYGKPVCANDFFDVENPDFTFRNIINPISSILKNLTLHVENEESYSETIAKLEACGVDYLNPFEANNMLKSLDKLPEIKRKKSSINWLAPLHFIAMLNSILPMLIWKYLKSGIKEVIFTNTFRFAVIVVLFPLFYLIQSAIIHYYFNLKFAFFYLVISVLLGIIVTKTKKVKPDPLT